MLTLHDGYLVETQDGPDAPYDPAVQVMEAIELEARAIHERASTFREIGTTLDYFATRCETADRSDELHDHASFCRKTAREIEQDARPRTRTAA